jgi:hypothetical protein
VVAAALIALDRQSAWLSAQIQPVLAAVGIRKGRVRRALERRARD